MGKPTRSTTPMASPSAILPNKGKGKVNSGRHTLSLSDILSDLDKLPHRTDRGEATNSQSSNDDDNHSVPASSESVDESIAISLRFIRQSQNLLRRTDVLEDVSARLDRVNGGLGDVEATVQA